MEFNATFFVSAISFIVFTFIMNLIFYKPLSKVINERKNLINDALSDAKNSTEQADSILKNKTERLQKTAKDSKKLINDRINEANEKLKILTSNAKLKSNEDIESAKEKLKLEAQELEKNLEIKYIAEVISSKVLGMDVKIDDEELIQ